MWAAGLGCFLVRASCHAGPLLLARGTHFLPSQLLCTFPGMWLGAGATLPAVQSHPPLMYVWVALILLVQLATMKYVWQRPSLCRQTGQGGHTALAVQPGAGPVPKQAAQAPTVDWHDWRNWIVMSTYVFEVLQFAGLVVSGTTPWVAGLRGALQGGRGVTDGLGTLVVLGDRVVPPDAQFWLPMAVVVVYVYCCGLYIALDWDAGHPMGPVLFQFLSGSLFVTVTSSLMSQLFTTTDLARHVACAEALVFYSCTSVFVSIYRGDTGKTEVRTLPFFLGWERVAKGCMVVAFVLLEATPVLQYGIMSVVLGAYAAATLVTLPCSVPALNALRAVSALMGLWGAIIRTAGEAPGSALADTPGGRRVSYILLAAGWAVLVVGGVAALLVRPDTFAAAGKDVSREAWEGRLSAPVPPVQPKRRRASLMSFKPQQDEDGGELELTALGTTPSLTTENPLRSASRASRGRRPSQPVSV